MVICRKCSTNVTTNFCPNCGTPVQVTRIDRHYVAHEIRHAVLHFEKGFLYTIKELIVRPGRSMKKFIEGDRAKHYKPIGFVVITSLIYTFVIHFLHFNELASASVEEKKILNTNTAKIFEWVGDHYNYSNLIEILFIALAFKLFFRKKKYNYFEYLVVLAYITGINMLFSALAIIMLHFLHAESIFNYVILFVFIYGGWAIGQFISDGKWTTYIKAFTAYLTGFIFFMIALFALGVTLDVLKISL